MQTFVVKLASGIAALLASVVIAAFHIRKDETDEVLHAIASSDRMGLRMCMTLIPIAALLIGLAVFKHHYILNEEKTQEIARELEKRKSSMTDKK